MMKALLATGATLAITLSSPSVSADLIANGRFAGLGSTVVDFAIDKVSMAAVAEPATWAMMLLGFGIVGSSVRRRKGDVSFA
jgi:hypothetical protein